MRNISVALLAILLVSSSDRVVQKSAAADAYVQANCYMVLDSGLQIVMENGNQVEATCFKLPGICAQGRPYHLNNVHYVVPAVYVQAPLEVCHAHL